MMKKNLTALLLCVLLMMTALPLTALAEAEDEWICSDCHIWVCGEYCLQCGQTRTEVFAENEAGGYGLTLDVDFNKNRFFSQYDLEVLINGEMVFYVNHGENLHETVTVPAGPCEIVFRYPFQRDMDMRFPVIMTGDAKLSVELKTHFYGIEVKSFSCTAVENTAPLTIGQGGVCNGFSITLTGVTTTEGNGALRAADGYEFVLVEYEIVNQTYYTQQLNADTFFENVCDGYVVSVSERGFMVTPVTLVSQLSSGGKTRGMLCFELPVGWRELKMTYGDKYSVNNSLNFVISGD